jgi:O-acetyl-ADP-ribose deacetylase (regulator of RNase III)
MPPVSRVRYTGLAQPAGACAITLTGHRKAEALIKTPTRALAGFARVLERIRPIMQIDSMG